jgi:hypothetical protein
LQKFIEQNPDAGQVEKALVNRNMSFIPDRQSPVVAQPGQGISVLDDYSRMILGWKVQPSMSSSDIIEVVQQAVEFTGQPTVPVEPGPALDEFLKLRAMRGQGLPPP